jgi:hypothetical protein
MLAALQPTLMVLPLVTLTATRITLCMLQQQQQQPRRHCTTLQQ